MHLDIAGKIKVYSQLFFVPTAGQKQASKKLEALFSTFFFCGNGTQYWIICIDMCGSYAYNVVIPRPLSVTDIFTMIVFFSLKRERGTVECSGSVVSDLDPFSDQLVRSQQQYDNRSRVQHNPNGITQWKTLHIHLHRRFLPWTWARRDKVQMWGLEWGRRPGHWRRRN